jgi:hypothetical protein
VENNKDIAMNNHPNCHGSFFPDFTALKHNHPLTSQAFSALVISHGIGVQSRKLEVNPEGWENCVRCPDYRTCYDLSLGKLVMNALMAGGQYGA